MTCKRQPYVYQALHLPNVFFSLKIFFSIFKSEENSQEQELSSRVVEFKLKSDLLSPQIFLFQRETRRAFPACALLSYHNI